MPTITIDLPDNLNVPANWDVRLFVITKMYEAGILSPDQAAQTVGVPQPQFLESARNFLPESVNPERKSQEPESPEAESWFTPEQIARFKENRRRLDEEWAKNPPPLTKDELLHLLLNGPVATEEEIQMQDEIQEMRKRWKSPW